MSENGPKPPLIITLKMDEKSQDFFNEKRQEHFPAHINYLNAHITLFHKLPSDEALVTDTLSSFAERKIFSLAVTGVKHIGNGVAYKIESETLQELHKSLQISFKPWLVKQDAHKLWPHVTIQNKVTNYKSELLCKSLSETFEPFNINTLGLQAWHYLNGPWSLQQEFLFSA